MPEFTSPTDGGKFIVEYEKVHYSLLSDTPKGKPNISLSMSFDIAKDGSDRTSHENEVRSVCSVLANQFPDRNWKLLRVFQNLKEEYQPEFPMSEEVFIP